MAEDTDLVLEERKKKVLDWLKHSSWIYILCLIVILIATFYIRTVNVPQLKDVTTGNYTLGPDLDPFLALRWAKYIVEHGSLMENDTMRYVPLGYSTKGELLLWPYSIVWVYNVFKFFDPSVSVEYAAIIHPVIFFLIALVFMFLFVRKIFDHEGKMKSNLIALLSTLIFAILPPLVHRTVAGIPEKEAPGIAFIMISLYFFVCMLQSKRIRKSVLFGALAGIATGMAGMFWGGYGFALLGIALAMFVSFFFNKISKKEIIGYASWIATFTVILGMFTTHYGGITNIIFSTTSGSCYFVLILFIIDNVLFHTRLKEKIHGIKLPRTAVSFIITSIIILILILIIDPSEINHILNDMYSQIFTPFAGSRFTLTVAENSRPFFDSWLSNFGKSFFWMFLVSSILLVYEIAKSIKEKWHVIVAYTLFIFSLVFSKYSPSSTLNGANFTSQAVYAGGFLIFAAVLVWTYFKAHKRNEELNFDKGLILLIALFFFGAISARGAIRLFILLAIPTPILVGFASVKLFEYAKQSKEEFGKWILWAVTGIFIFMLVFSLQKNLPFVQGGVIPTFEQRTYYEARYTVPSAYTMQWQIAMAWVREDTPKDAVFAHWWDYGYWLQSIGERATVLDGGNAITYWDHLLGRHVLTGRNETEALEFLKIHDADYLLIDSTDIGKYPAYASIGSDENYDRYSWVNTFLIDDKSSKETRNETLYVYRGGSANDEDIIWENQIIPQQSAGIAGFMLPLDKQTKEIKQPSIIIIYQNKQINIPIKCVYLKYTDKKYEFENGLDSCLYIVPSLDSSKINNLGAALYLSERAMKTLWVKLYLFDEAKNFELVHSEQDLVVEQLRHNYNLTIPDFIYYQDIKGPIKIWKINYPNDTKENPEYLKTDFPSEGLWLPRGV
jgi:dolichyl-diphosphooligosaccharide--protein glycosyltransferase